MSKKGDYVVVIGGKSGALFDGHKWLSFECRHCIADKLLNRIGTNDSIWARNKAYSTKYDLTCQLNPKHR